MRWRAGLLQGILLFSFVLAGATASLEAMHGLRGGVSLAESKATHQCVAVATWDFGEIAVKQAAKYLLQSKVW